MEHTSAETIIRRARARTDTETPSPDDDHISDDYLTETLGLAYRSLIDMVLAASGEAAIELFGRSATLTAGNTALPDQCYRVVDLRRWNGHTWQPLPTANWRTRQRGGTSDWPIYTAVNGTLVFDPPNASPGDLKLWYIPTLDALGDQPFLTVNGWDEYLIGYLSNEIAVKSDLPAGEHRDLMKDSSTRIKQAVRDLKMGHTKTLASVESFAEDFFGRW